MTNRVKSAKGVMVDFDALKIKEQLASSPTPIEVREREDFIESRIKRKIKKKLAVPAALSVEVEPTLPEPDTNEIIEDEPAEELIDKKEDKNEAVTKQKARRKKT